MSGRSIDATNHALVQLGQRWASGEIDAETYLAQSFRLVSALEGLQRDDDLPSEQQTHPGLPPVNDRPTAGRRWLWLLPVLFALIFLGLLALLLS